MSPSESRARGLAILAGCNAYEAEGVVAAEAIRSLRPAAPPPDEKAEAGRVGLPMLRTTFNVRSI
eukprot:scaffold177559_cov31-Tisochrysis_lutea.AAC.4